MAGSVTPLGAAVLGLTAGTVRTAAMTAAQPPEVGKRISEGPPAPNN